MFNPISKRDTFPKKDLTTEKLSNCRYPVTANLYDVLIGQLPAYIYSVLRAYRSAGAPLSHIQYYDHNTVTKTKTNVCQ